LNIRIGLGLFDTSRTSVKKWGNKSAVQVEKSWNEGAKKKKSSTIRETNSEKSFTPDKSFENMKTIINLDINSWNEKAITEENTLPSIKKDPTSELVSQGIPNTEVSAARSIIVKKPHWEINTEIQPWK